RECTKSVKKKALKPWLNKRWCIGKITTEYLWHMEDILYQYARPYDPLIPLLCDDERPRQLLGDLLVPLPMQSGQPKRSDHEYERHGTCCVLLAFENHASRPLGDRRALRRMAGASRAPAARGAARVVRAWGTAPERRHR